METRKIKTLFVEDEALLRTLFEDSLSIEKEDYPGYSFKLETVSDYGAAVKRIKDGEIPDILILDLRLPRGESESGEEIPEKEYGFEILRLVKADQKFAKMPVIIFTNLADRETEIKSYELGADRFLIKSKTVPHELFAAVMEVVREAIDKKPR